MDAALKFLNYFIVFVFSTITVHAVPPEACFANFRWDDCGHPPTPVMYYWKPGSRCEVGLWRGCLPNLNMFHDEYECINTCIFVARAQPEDYHNHFNVIPMNEEITVNDTITVTNVTADSNGTQSQNETATTVDVGNGTDTGGANSTNSETTVKEDAVEEEETTADGGETTADGGETTADGGKTTADGGETTADGGSP